MAASRRRQRLTEEHKTKTEPTRPKMEQPGRPSIRISLDPAAVSDTAIMTALGGNADHWTAASELSATTELPIDAQDINMFPTAANSDLGAAGAREEREGDYMYRR